MASLEKLQELVKEHLDPEERLVAVVYGAYDCKLLGSDSARNGVFVATDQRLVFYAKKMFGYDLEVFPYERISSFEMSKGLMGHEMKFLASGNRIAMKWINKGDLPAFVSYVRQRLSEPPPAVSAASASVDIPDQIRKLAQLKDAGVLSESEFQLKKAELLSRL